MIARDVSRGLQYLHEKHNCMHLDVKAENIVLVQGVAKIIDFAGVCNELNPSRSMSYTVAFLPPGMHRINN